MVPGELQSYPSGKYFFPKKVISELFLFKFNLKIIFRQFEEILRLLWKSLPWNDLELLFAGNFTKLKQNLNYDLFSFHEKSNSAPETVFWTIAKIWKISSNSGMSLNKMDPENLLHDLELLKLKQNSNTKNRFLGMLGQIYCAQKTYT